MTGDHLPQSTPELDRLMAMQRVVERYFPEDVEFIVRELLDEEDEVSFLYGQLLEIGEDPDEVLAQFGIIEGGEGEV